MELLGKVEDFFNKQSRLIKIILLLIPFVNWVFEICIRWHQALKEKSVLKIVVAIIVTFFGLPFGWIDLIWVLLFNRLILG